MSRSESHGITHHLISDAFKHLVASIAPRDRELKKAALHFAMIRSRLSQTFELRKFMQVGSHWKGTAIRSFSDVDVFAVMSRSEARKWARDGGSDTLISRVRCDLQGRFPNTRVRRDGQAVVVNFAQGQYAVEVVPAIFEAFDKTPSYLIPDGAGGWITTFPDADKAFLLSQNGRSGGRVISLVRLLKWWACSRATTLPAKSRYFETALCQLGITPGHSYQGAIASVLWALADADCPPLRDPSGRTSEDSVIATTAGQQEVVRRAVEAAADRSRRAREAEVSANWREAQRLWDLVFNGAFFATRT